MDSRSEGKSFQNLAYLLMLCGGFMLAGSWVLYNALNNTPSIPLLLSYVLWGSAGAITIVLSFIFWFVGHNTIMGKISLNKKTEFKRLIILLKDMSKGAPSWYYSKQHIKKFISTDDGIDQLVKIGVINDDGKNSGHSYYITATGIQLISAAESIKTNQIITVLTIILVILGVLGIIF